MQKLHIFSAITIISLLAACLGGGRAAAQPTWNESMWGTSDPSVEYDCGIYQWPEVQVPCPEVQIKQKHDHTAKQEYQAQGWDTAVTCAQRQIVLSCMPYMPVQYFNGQYTVDTIPYDPPDPTFSRGTKMPVTTDDDFASDSTLIPFNFYFFGLKKSSFVLGANGLITFNRTSAGKYCPPTLEATATLPWPDSKTSAPHGLDCNIAHMRDAIYGIYEDTHPLASYLHGNQGIYYGVQDEFPCRKIICSWNGIPTYRGSSNLNNRCTYQIVCYEGSNIIEVHIKRRGVDPLRNTNGLRGLIGVQNATGQPQERGMMGSPNRNVFVNSPAAYYPAEGNLLTQAIDTSIAFRFTPQGALPVNKSEWYRIFDDGRDSIPLTTDVTDTNGYYTPMGSVSTCPNLTTAVVQPTSVSRYVYHLRFLDANSTPYDLYDTITIGVDTAKALTFRPQYGTPADHQLDICSGDDARLMIEFPELQDTTQMIYHITRISNGDSIPLPDTLITFGSMYVNVETSEKRIPAILHPDAHSAHMQPGEIDSINIQLIVNYVSGCHNNNNLLVRTFPAYDVTDTAGICNGEVYHWDKDGHDYTTSTTAPQVNIPTAVGCDSVVHLNLTVSDISYTIDYVNVCKPYTWQNGRTYTETNTATALTDTVHLQNVWGCDSTVQLDFVMHPLVPLIEVDRDHFDFNHFDIVLTDVSTGGEGRTWYFPTADPQTTPVAHYTAPYDIDSAIIYMVETSPYGCIDTASVTIPFHRNVIWVPNAFLPEDPDNGNDRFHSVSNHLLKEHTYIYNRRGELMYECDEIDCEWDGTDPNGNPCPQGAYIYLIRYTTEYEPHVTQVVKGSVTLIR